MRSTSRPWLSWPEALVTILVVLILVGLARPLAQSSSITGLAGRYSEITAQPTSGDIPSLITPDRAERSSQRQQARRLLAQAGTLVAILAIVGWLVLTLGRLGLPAGGFLALAVALWAVAGYVIGPFGLPGRPFAQVALAAGLLVPPMSRLWPTRLLHQRATACWLYPGFVLLTGLSLLWLSDYAARGWPDGSYPFLGIHRLAHLYLAYIALTLCAGLSPLLLDTLARQASRWDGLGPMDRASRRWALLLLALWLGLLLAAISIKTGGNWRNVDQAAAVTSEMLRVPAWLILGWSGYRWLECGQRPSRTLLTLSTVSGILIVALFATHDNGQILLYSLAACLFVGVWLTGLSQIWTRGKPVLNWVLTLLNLSVCIALIATVLWAVHHLAPAHFENVAQRIAAMAAPFASRLVYLAELGWFNDAIPSGGYGLTQVPWCGHLGSLGGPCIGVPKQLISDYVFFGVAGVWGVGAAVLLTLFTLAWLLALARLPSGGGLPVRSLNHLSRWLLAVFVANAICQVLLTALGALGGVILTGVTWPLLAHGATSLLITAMFAGLALNLVDDSPQAGTPRTHPS